MKRLASLVAGLALGLVIGAAYADVVVAVSADCPVQSLTRSELEDIYLGRLDRLSGGDRVVPIDQGEESPAHHEFYNDYLGRSPAQIKAHWSKLIFTGRGQPPQTVADGAAAAEAAARTACAIAYLDPDQVDHRLRVLPIE